MTEILNTKLVCVYVGLRKWKIPSTLCIMCRFSPHHYLQKPTLTVTADDHYKNTCKFEQYWKMCKQPGHLTGSDKCRSFVAHQEDIGCFEYSRKDDPLSDFPYWVQDFQANVSLIRACFLPNQVRTFWWP